MKNNLLLLGAALLAFTSCSVHKTPTSAQTSDSSNHINNAASGTPLFAKMHIRDTIKTGDSVLMRFTVYNNTDSAQKFCKWHTPFEPLMSKYLDVKDANGQEMLYQGAMAKRVMPPPADSYTQVNAKDSIFTTVNLIKAYAIKAPSKYTIVYTSQNISGLTVKDSVSFNYVK